MNWPRIILDGLSMRGTILIRMNYLTDKPFLVILTCDQKTDQGWSKDLGPPRSGEFPRYSCFVSIVEVKVLADKILSVFIDESGTFSNCESHDDRYVVGLVFHDQDIDISSNIRSFKDHLIILGKENHFVHTAPLIRREHPYGNNKR